MTALLVFVRKAACAFTLIWMIQFCWACLNTKLAPLQEYELFGLTKSGLNALLEERNHEDGTNFRLGTIPLRNQPLTEILFPRGDPHGRLLNRSILYHVEFDASGKVCRVRGISYG